MSLASFIIGFILGIIITSLLMIKLLYDCSQNGELIIDKFKITYSGKK